MRGWGITFLVLGIGSFILPRMGLQFWILELFGESAPVAAIVMFVIGVVLLGMSFMGGPSDETPQDAPPSERA